MAQPTRVALALGGGGARGYAHIGVIQVLREQGYEVVSIAGSSMGAVVGGLHAAGRLGPYTDWVRTLTQRDVWRLLDPSFKAPGVIRAEKVLAQVSELLGDVLIEELCVPFTAVATDLLAGKEVWFQHGPAAPAIRASFALPSFISPVVLNGRLLADGGLLNPVPVAPTAAALADMTVAVSLSEVHLTHAGAAPAQGSAELGLTEESLDRSRGTVAQMLDGDLMRTISSWFTGGRGSPAVDDEEEVAEQVDDEMFGDLPPGPAHPRRHAAVPRRAAAHAHALPAGRLPAGFAHHRAEGVVPHARLPPSQRDDRARARTRRRGARSGGAIPWVMI